MLSFGEEAFEELSSEVGFCLDNLQHPDCELKFAGRFYELAAECLRAHAILRILIDANPDKFSSDLVLSGYARRAFLRRCQKTGFWNYYGALSRTGSLFDAIAGDDLDLAAEIARLSPAAFRQGDEYEDDFWYQRYVGLLVSGAPEAERLAALGRFEVAEANSIRLQLCQALERRDGRAFEEAFEELLRQRTADIETDSAAKEDLATAIGTKIFIEGVALLKLASRAGLTLAGEYSMCPTMAVERRQPTRPRDEFAQP
jgi:hypothetical protein